jgi:transposase
MEYLSTYGDNNNIPRNGQKDIKKNEIKPWRSQEWCIPPEEGSGFVAAMEDILDVYTRKYDENTVLICQDEVPRQLIGETRKPVPAGRGKAARYDTEYKRNGTCEIFMFSSPVKGWRRAEVTEHRTRLDRARQVKKLITVDFPHIKKIVLAVDNLNTHTIGSLYKTFPPEEAKRLRDKLEIHYTPKHGSWLNMAEIEINVLVNHGLSKRIPTIQQMKKEVKAWNKARNKTASKINWRFSTDDARIKLKHLYPQIV